MNLLTDPLLPVDLVAGGNAALDLPTLLERLGRDEIAGYPFLRPHQRFPWHAFLAQLACLALHRAGASEVVLPAEQWRHLIRSLTPRWTDDAPWRLVVDDLTKPAFLQPPVPEGRLEGWGVEAHPDDLDVLVTSKNHGVKQGQGAGAAPAAWVASEISLQTTGGFLGAGNYGVARMNGGFATRPGIGLVPRGGPSARFVRDARVLLANRGWCLGRVTGFQASGGRALLWLEPWDGASSLEVSDLDPFFIEICRRTRLQRAGQAIVARTKPTKAARIVGGPFKGNLGDPWIPIKAGGEPAAYNSVPAYRVMSAVLFDPAEWTQPLLLGLHEGDEAPITARFDVFVRGQGKTEGYFEREVPIGKQTLSLFATDTGREMLARLAKEMIEDARSAQGILRRAILLLIQDAENAGKLADNGTTKWRDRLVESLDRRIDHAFFAQLHARVEGGDDAAGHHAWLTFLRDELLAVFLQARDAAPTRAGRRLRAEAIAETMLWAGMRKSFEPLFRKETADAA